MDDLLQARLFHLHVIASPKGVAIRRSRCEGKARGNLKRSLASLGTRIASLRPESRETRDGAGLRSQ